MKYIALIAVEFEEEDVNEVGAKAMRVLPHFDQQRQQAYVVGGATAEVQRTLLEMAAKLTYNWKDSVAAAK